jgi:hypothetical protein
MRNEHKPGDLAVRIAFGRVYGGGPDQGMVKPSIEIEDQKSGKHLVIELTAGDIAELLAASRVEVPASHVRGFGGLRDWGKTHEMVTRTVKVEPNDWKVPSDSAKAVRALPHVAKVIAEVEADGYRCDAPRRNNGGQWIIIGRRYVDGQ